MGNFAICLLLSVLATALSNPVNNHEEIAKRIVESVRSHKVMLEKKRELTWYGLTPAEHDQALNIQNAYRKTVDASNMEKLGYNMALSAMAHELTKSCNFQNSGPSSWPNSPFEWGMVGYNKYATSTSSLDLKWGLRAFYNEWTSYNEDENTCSRAGDCDRYTQLMWADTTLVGCAATFCPEFTSVSGSVRQNMHFMACAYGPAGNFQGVRPWKEGPACTECSSGTFWCDAGLCRSDLAGTTSVPEGIDCNGACQNGEISCACDCQCNLGFMGNTCDAPCADTDEMCGGDYGDWMCEPDFGYRQVMVKKCPATCGLCGTESPTACNFSAAGGK